MPILIDQDKEIVDGIRRARRRARKPTSIGRVCRELCIGTWREEEQEHREYDVMRSDPLTVAMFGRGWEEWPRHFSTLEECIQVHCRGLEKILLARLKEEGEPEL